MAQVVLDADAVAQVVTYVVPGVVGRYGYRARFPVPECSAGEVLIISVVASLPLVALVHALIPGEQRPTQVGCVAALLVVSFVLGYILAWVRGTSSARRLLGKLGYRGVPEGSMFAQTFLTADATVTSELKDGRRVSGCPRSGPSYKDDGINELYLVYPDAVDEHGKRHAVGAGLIVPLTEVSSVALSEEPTGAPSSSAPKIATNKSCSRHAVLFVAQRSRGR